MKKAQQKPSIISASSFVLISLICLLVACGSDESKLVGKWIPENEGKIPSNFPGKSFELFKDGTGVRDGYSINWKVNNNRFILNSSVYNYTVSDSTLTLTDDNGKSVDYDNFATIERRIAERDRKEYKSVKIGNQVWMTENLNYKASGSKCYDNENVNCDKYGRLYDWENAMKACPKDWHLPDNDEWHELIKAIKAVDSNKTVSKHLKAKSGWNENGNGDDTYGFAALPGGYGNSGGSSFNDIGKNSYWWSNSIFGPNSAHNWILYYNKEGVYYDLDSRELLFSVRCVKD